MKTYRYYAELFNGKDTIVWKGRAENIRAFITETEKRFADTEWKVSRSGKCQPEQKREKKFYSMAFVDMGQAARN